MDPTLLTGEHVRQACRLLRWNSLILSRKAHLPFRTIKLLRPRENVDPDLAAKLLTVFQAAGIEFIPENGSGAGVRLRKGLVQ